MYATTADLEALVQYEIPVATSVTLLERASQAVDGYVRSPLAEDGYVESFEPAGATIWVVPSAWPLTVSGVEEDGETLTTDDYEVSVGGSLKRIDTDGNATPWGDEVTVTYTTGFAAGSFEIATADRIVLEIAAEAAANPQNLDSFSADGVTQNFRRGHGVLSLAKEHREQLGPLRWRRTLA
jgi:hypothetical protein